MLKKSIKYSRQLLMLLERWIVRDEVSCSREYGFLLRGTTPSAGVDQLDQQEL